jgi:hypothetical protein
MERTTKGLNYYLISHLESRFIAVGAQNCSIVISLTLSLDFVCEQKN